MAHVRMGYKYSTSRKFIKFHCEIISGEAQQKTLSVPLDITLGRLLSSFFSSKLKSLQQLFDNQCEENLRLDSP